MLKLLRYNKIWFLSVGLLLILSCEVLEEPDLVNPLDPENPEYIPPKTTILSGPGEGEVLAVPDVSITWRGNIAGSEYSFRLDSSVWSDWGVDSTVLLRLLDEADHLFEVRTRYPSGDIEDPPTSLSFTVDAIKGPAFIFYPRLTNKNTGESFTLELMAEEVDSFAIGEVVVEFDTAFVSFVSAALLSDASSFLGSSGGSVLEFIDLDSDNNIVVINFGVVGGDPPFVQGSGVIAHLIFTGLGKGETSVRINSLSLMRKSDNTTIRVNEFIEGVILLD